MGCSSCGQRYTVQPAAAPLTEVVHKVRGTSRGVIYASRLGSSAASQEKKEESLTPSPENVTPQPVTGESGPVTKNE